MDYTDALHRKDGEQESILCDNIAKKFFQKTWAIYEAENAFRQLGKPSEEAELAQLLEAEQKAYHGHNVRSWFYTLTNWVMPFCGTAPVTDEDLRYNCDAVLVSRAFDVLKHYGLQVKLERIPKDAAE